MYNVYTLCKFVQIISNLLEKSSLVLLYFIVKICFEIQNKLLFNKIHILFFIFLQSYLIVTKGEIILFADSSKIGMKVRDHLRVGHTDPLSVQ